MHSLGRRPSSHTTPLDMTYRRELQRPLIRLTKLIKRLDVHN